MIICADDFGFSTQVNRGIFQLVKKEKISAVSCMMTGSNISAELFLLKPYLGKIDLGLHLVLTNEKCLSQSSIEAELAMPNGRFLSSLEVYKKIASKKISKNAVYLEFLCQLEYFRELLGVYPDFIDGHEHVHQLPLVRDAFLQLLSIVQKEKKVYARNTKMPPSLFLFYAKMNPQVSVNAFLISIFGKQLQDRLLKNDIPTNPHIFGYHKYRKQNGIDEAFEFAIKNTKSANDIFFLHPGERDYSLNIHDPIALARPQNLDYFLEESTHLKLVNKNISLNRFQF